MELKKAKRHKAYLKLGVSAVSGGGKSMSALLLAKGLVGDWDKIGVIDTENGSANLYEHLGNYNVLELKTFSPNDYIKAIDVCLQAGMKCIIIDGISFEWDWCLAYQTKLGGKYQDWGQVTPLHDAFKNKILQSPVHVITTVRRKQEYEIVTEGGKTKVNKVGLAEQTRGGYEYELTLNFEIDENHLARASKDRTGLFVDKIPFKITEETGIELKNWANAPSNNEEELQKALVEVTNSDSLETLKKVFANYTEFHENESFKSACTNKKQQFS